MADNNFYFSVYSGEQIDKALGMFLNSGLEEEVQKAADSAAAAADALEATEKVAQDVMASGAFVGNGSTTVEEYHEAYQDGRLCFMNRTVGVAGDAHTGLWVMDYVYWTPNFGYAYFYRVHENGVVQCGKLDNDNTFTVIEGEAKIFVGNADTTAREYYEAFNAGKACVMIRTQGGAGNTAWVLHYTAANNENYAAHFYNIVGSNINYGTLDSNGSFNYETTEVEGKLFVGTADTTAKEFYRQHYIFNKCCFMLRDDGGGNNIQWVMFDATKADTVYSASFYHVTDKGVTEYATLDNEGAFTYEEIDVNSKADASTTTTAGTYGGYDSSSKTYSIPNITVNEQGVVTGASVSSLTVVGQKTNGIMSYDMYNYSIGSGHITILKATATTAGELSVVITNCSSTSFVVGSSVKYVPRIYGVYVLDPASDHWKPYQNFDAYAVYTTAITTTVTVNVESEHINSDTGNAVFVVMYEKAYGSTSSSM